MALKSRADLKSANNSTFTDNDAGDIESAAHRSFNVDLIDSLGGGDLASENEVLTGEIFDGKPVYAKVIKANVTIPAGGAHNISTGLSPKSGLYEIEKAAVIDNDMGIAHRVPFSDPYYNLHAKTFTWSMIIGVMITNKGEYQFQGDVEVRIKYTK